MESEMKLFKPAKTYGLALGVLTTMLMGSSCSLMIPDRSYMEEMNRESDPFFMAGRDFPVVSGDSGNTYRSREEVKKRTPASEAEHVKEVERASIRRELEEKEADIPESELAQYARDKRYLPGDSDKIYYLGLSGLERENYIKIRKQDLQRSTGKDQDLAESHSVHSSELFLGMDKNQVMEVWGRPVKVEIAGNPKNQNERWAYVEDGNTKFIYFESGKVQGWALDL